MDSTQSMPKPGEVRHTKLPDMFDGIRFEIGRFIRYVQEGSKHPLIVSTAKRIIEDYRSWRKREDALKDGETLKVIHGWARSNYAYVPNPPNITLMETPIRQVKRLLVPQETEAMLYEPFIRDAGSLMKPQAPKITGSLANSVTLVLSLVAAMGVGPLRMRFGGSDGTLYYPWASAYAGGRWYDLDILRPFDEPELFAQVEDVEVPIP